MLSSPGTGIWTCPNCGNVGYNVPIGISVTCKCGYKDLQGKEIKQANPIPPSILRRGKNYIQAWQRWRRAGRTIRSDEQVAYLRTICQECPRFNGQICTHQNCGCDVTGSGSIFGDKLRWLSESCPDGKW